MTKNDIYNLIKTDKHLHERQFKEKFPELYSELVSIKFPDSFKFRQKLYHLLNNDNEIKIGICPECGKRCSFINLNNGYYKHCSRSCSTKSLETQAKRQITCLTVYGVTHESKSETIKEKKRKTCNKNLGVNYPMQSKTTQEKSKSTNMRNRGTEYAFQAEQVKEKSRKTCQKNLGVDHLSKSETVKEKKRKTCNKNLGVDYPAQSKTVQDKISRTCEKKTRCEMRAHAFYKISNEKQI